MKFIKSKFTPGRKKEEINVNMTKNAMHVVKGKKSQDEIWCYNDECKRPRDCHTQALSVLKYIAAQRVGLITQERVSDMY